MKLENKKPKLFVDMDGVLAEWKPAQIPLQLPKDKIQQMLDDILYQEGYYKNLHPYKNVVGAIQQIIQDGKIDVYILSCVLPKDNRYPNSDPLQDKKDWLDKYFGNLIPDSHRIFVPNGEPKAEHIPFELTSNDYLLDDYSKNLHDWTCHSNSPKGIKLLNPYNDTKQSWTGLRISCTDSSDLLAAKINDIVLNHKPLEFKSPTIIRNVSFEIYKQDWIIQHNIYTDISLINQYYKDLNSDHTNYFNYEDWLKKNFKDYPSFPSFLHNEYLNSSYMKNLLNLYSPDLYESYLEDDLIQDITLDYD